MAGIGDADPVERPRELRGRAVAKIELDDGAVDPAGGEQAPGVAFARDRTANLDAERPQPVASFLGQEIIVIRDQDRDALQASTRHTQRPTIYIMDQGLSDSMVNEWLGLSTAVVQRPYRMTTVTPG